MKTFTKTFLRANRYGYTHKKLNAFSFMHTGRKPVSLSEIIESEISLRYKFWLVCYNVAAKEENHQIAIKCAETVLPLFEKVYPENKTLFEEIYPENKALRENIETARLYITGRTDLKDLLLKTKVAAYVTESAADAISAIIFSSTSNTGHAHYFAANAAFNAAKAAAYATQTDAVFQSGAECVLTSSGHTTRTITNKDTPAIYIAGYTIKAAYAVIDYMIKSGLAVDIEKQLLQILIDFAK